VAVGTSLMIIALKSLTGFVKYLDVLATLDLAVDWRLIGIFALIGTIGSMVGNWLASRTPQARLRQAFGVFLLVMAVFVLYSNLGARSASAEPRVETVGMGEMTSGPSPQGEWIELFNGRDLSRWTPKVTGYALGDNFGDTFRVEDGLLKVAYDGYDTFDGRFGHLFYEESFSHYFLRVEYRFVGEQAPGGPSWALRNSGVMIHGEAPEAMARDQDFPVSIEVQFLGGDGTGERRTANLCTPGTNVVMDEELITRHCTESSSRTYHLDEWVVVEVEVRGGEVVRHLIDGEVVLEYGEPQLDNREQHSHDLAAARGGLLLEGGSISLQSESHPIEFRRVALRRLR